jgi:hypothetical protein
MQTAFPIAIVAAIGLLACGAVNAQAPGRVVSTSFTSQQNQPNSNRFV